LNLLVLGNVIERDKSVRYLGLRCTTELEVACHQGEGFTKRLKMETNPQFRAHLSDKAEGATS